MKIRVILALALCAALVICGCGSQEASASAPAEAKAAASEQKAEAPAANENEPAATPEPDYESLSLEELAALPIEPELLMSLVMDRMPEVTFEEIEALGVFNEDMLAEIFDYWDYLMSQMPAPTPEPTPAPDPVTGATVGLTKGTVSHQTGYAIPSGEELTSPSDGFMELDLGNGNYVLLFQDTQATLLRFGSQLQVNVSHGWMSFYFGAPEKLDCSLTWVTDLCSADMTSRCGYMSRERGAGYVQIVSYLGEMTLHLKDGATAATKDGVYTMVKGGQTVEEREPFSGKFQGMKTMILNHQEMAEPLAAAYDMTPGAVLLTVGIRTEPEIIIRDLGNGTYDRSVIDVNGDVVESGRFNTEDDSLVSNYTYEYDENHRRIREVWNTPGNSWDGKVTTWTYYDTGEVKTDSYTMPDGRFENREYDKQEHVILLEAGVNGVVETHQETEYNEAGTRIHERTVGKDYIAESFYDDAGRQLRHVRTDREGNKINVFVYTYYENGQKATERTEDYSINGMWYETAYDEAGNVTSQESGKLE